MNKLLTFNTLPPATKEAICVIGKMYYSRYSKWRMYYDKLWKIRGTVRIMAKITRGAVAIAHLSATPETRNNYSLDPIEAQHWLQTIEVFELLTDDIRE